MDPLSALFAGFVQQAGESISQAAISGMNAEPETVIVDYHDQRVSFVHQLWRIRPESVCADQRARLADDAPCTQAAQALFEEACARLTAQPVRDPAARSLRTMYCNAAERFQPTQANIQWSDNRPATIQDVDCRRAKALQVLEDSAENRARVQAACAP
jgi:hypothetical protein